MIDYDAEIKEMGIKETKESKEIFRVLRGTNLNDNNLTSQWDVCHEMYKRVSNYYFNKNQSYQDLGCFYDGMHWSLYGESFHNYFKNLLRYLLDMFPIINFDNYNDNDNDNITKFSDYYNNIKYSPHPIWIKSIANDVDQRIIYNRNKYIVSKKILDIYLLIDLRKIVVDYLYDELLIGLNEDDKKAIILYFSN